jgi:hypothetical protein
MICRRGTRHDLSHRLAEAGDSDRLPGPLDFRRIAKQWVLNSEMETSFMATQLIYRQESRQLYCFRF